MKIYLLIILLLIAFTGSSQNYFSFPDSNAAWCGQRSQLFFNPPNDQVHRWTYQQFITNDTLINGELYHKLEENGVFEWEDYPIPFNSGSSTYFHQYVGCIREVNKILYYVPPTSPTENYLYNFNFMVGDTLPSNILTPSNYTMITRIDSILIAGNYRKQFFVSVVDTNLWQMPTHFEYVSIIEGIGSTNGLNWTLMPYFERGGSLWALKQDGTLIYTDSIATSCDVTGYMEINPIVFKIYPNPASESFEIEFSGVWNFKYIQIIDVSGKVVIENILNSYQRISVSTLDPGLYFVRIYDRENHSYHKLFSKL
ncbi:MAG: T9SS type A sorting domain-containing protein [Bacteroidetes bacterium]|nr:T9SS type A sorting domain-containing protein [Bacteroidota bacterium]